MIIGFGRAVGETMVVLMATSNTPIMEMDADLAYKVRFWDDQVDEAKKAIRIQIEAIVQKDASQQQYLGMLFSVSRSLEHIADHATHIAEDVIYMLKSQIVRHEVDSQVREGG